MDIRDVRLNTLGRGENFFSRNDATIFQMRNFAADGQSGTECSRKEEQHEPAGWELVIYVHVCFTEAFIKLLISKRVLVGASSSGATPD